MIHNDFRKRWPLWLRVMVALAILVVLVAPLWLWRDDIGRIFANREQVVVEVRSAGAWGPLIVIGLAVGQTIVAPIPGQVVNLVAGYVFGLLPGLAYSWLGLLLGTVLAMMLARHAGRPIVERIVDRRLLERFDRLAAQGGLRFFFLCFLIPGLPDDLLCFVAGLTSLPLRVLVLLSVTARIPGLLAAVWLGAEAERLPWPFWVAGGVLGAIALWAVWRHGDRLQEALLRLTLPPQNHGERK